MCYTYPDKFIRVILLQVVIVTLPRARKVNAFVGLLNIHVRKFCCRLKRPRRILPDFQHFVSVAVSRCRCRFRKNRVRTGRCCWGLRGNSAAGPGARAPSFPCKKVGGAPGAYERQIRKNGTRPYMNGNGELTETIALFFT